jgi:oligosaccharide reducing-end xylanase
MPTGGHDKFGEDAFRVAANVGLDYLWFAADPWEKELVDRIQSFFVKEGIGKYYSKYKIDGTPVQSANTYSITLVATNAMASCATDGPNAKLMVADLWSKSPVTGQSRYFADCWYLFSLLALSGNYRIW